MATVQIVHTNKRFCYWLQGYFEIGLDVTVNKRVMMMIKKELDAIEEPLGTFTSWLYELCLYMESLSYNDALCEHFSPIIARSLNAVFFHVIDNTYITDKPKVLLQAIHDGQIA